MPRLAAYSIAETLKGFDIEIDNVPANALVNDSRLANEHSIFCAVVGSQDDGRQYIDAAVANGTPLVIAQCLQKHQHGNVLTKNVDGKTVNIIQFFELDSKLTELAQCFYGYPHHALKMVGITGTNGKTSTSQFVANFFKLLDQPSGVIGTIGAGPVGQLAPIVNTTPGPTEFNQLLAGFVHQGIQAVAMEVSSHALDQHRVSPNMFDIAVYTNLSRDHLDYHKTMDAYAKAKFRLFTGDKSQTAVINGDDAYGNSWLAKQDNVDNIIVYGRNDRVAEYKRYVKAQQVKHTNKGLSFTLVTESEQIQIESPLMGDFNVDNLLAAISVLRAADAPMKQIVEKIPDIHACDGRMESFTQEDKPTCIVDYAHTPDALENALKASRQHCQGELWVVFGCGGDRDKGKRSMMGEVAERLSDHMVITNDNPRCEAPELIANDILGGCQAPEKIAVMLDRTQAVQATISNAANKDVVLLAGKGHENSIQVGKEIIEYNERELVKSIYDTFDVASNGESS